MLILAYFLVCPELCRSNQSCAFLQCAASAAHFLFIKNGGKDDYEFTEFCY